MMTGPSEGCQGATGSEGYAGQRFTPIECRTVLGSVGRLIVIVAAAALPACAARSGSVPRPFPGAPVPPQATATPTEPAPLPQPGDEPRVATAPAPRPESLSAEPPVAPPEAAPSWPSTILTTALDLLGTPYRNGGSTPAGFDCSGFVQWVFAQLGAALPREVREQAVVGSEIDRAELRPGDLIFFRTTAGRTSHVGIVVDGESFVHAPSSRGVVRVERFTGPYWSRRFVGVRRVDATATASAVAGVQAQARPDHTTDAAVASRPTRAARTRRVSGPR